MDKLAEILKSATRVGILTGAGISAESGIPTFRGKDGLWNRYDPTALATLEAFESNPLMVWQWYLWRMWLISKAIPNEGHYAVADMEKVFPEFLLITQNVDGLHKRAGSKKLVELHGNIFEGKCRECGKRFGEGEFGEIFGLADRKTLASLTKEEFEKRVLKNLKEEDLPLCPLCGSIIGPGVVWFGEALPEDALDKAFSFAKGCDLFFSVGTSGVVQPAASLPLVAKNSGAVVVEINLEETPLSYYCDFTLRGSASKVLPEILRLLRE